MTAHALNRRTAEGVLPALRAALGGVEMCTQDDVIGFTLRGTLFAIVQDGVLFFRVDARTRGAYDEAEAEARVGETDATPAEAAMEPPGGGALAVAPYRRLPLFVLDDEDTLARWGRAAWEAARRSRQGANG